MAIRIDAGRLYWLDSARSPRGGWGVDKSARAPPSLTRGRTLEKRRGCPSRRLPRVAVWLTGGGQCRPAVRTTRCLLEQRDAIIEVVRLL